MEIQHKSSIIALLEVPMREMARPTWQARRNNLFSSTTTPNLRCRGTCRKISSTNAFRWRFGDDASDSKELLASGAGQS